MKEWEKFSTFKHRGEWVELLFMAAAAVRGFNISRPWGDSAPYDVGIDRRSHFLRVQVKSTTERKGAGYLCGFKRGYYTKQDYALDQIDLFAAYVIPENVWYVIPCCALGRKTQRGSHALSCNREAGWL